MDIERKEFALEVKEVNDDFTFQGYASVFDVEDEQRDIVAKGAFKRSLRAHKKAGTMPALLWQHWMDEPIGKWMEFIEDDYGLLGHGKLFVEDIPKARQAYRLLKERAINGLSIGYVVAENGAKVDRTGLRTLKQVELMETSIVTFPANRLARVSLVKSGVLPSERDFERWLTHDAGLTRSQARNVLSKGYRDLLTRAKQDAGEDDDYTQDAEVFDEEEASSMIESLDDILKELRGQDNG